ncbi:MAG: hypothetical protein ACT4OU_03325 [Hyphomicrobium sp.]
MARRVARRWSVAAIVAIATFNTFSAATCDANAETLDRSPFPRTFSAGSSQDTSTAKQQRVRERHAQNTVVEQPANAVAPPGEAEVPAQATPAPQTAAQTVEPIAATAESSNGGVPANGDGVCSLATPDPTLQANFESKSVSELILSQRQEPAKICALLAPIILKSPEKTVEVIDAVKADSALAEPLGQCLSALQKCLAADNPDGAKKIAELMMSAPASLQAAYAVALDGPGDQGGGDSGSGTQGAGETSGGGGADGVQGFGTLSLGGAGGSIGGASGDVSVSVPR